MMRNVYSQRNIMDNVQNYTININQTFFFQISFLFYVVSPFLTSFFLLSKCISPVYLINFLLGTSIPVMKYKANSSTGIPLWVKDCQTQSQCLSGGSDFWEWGWWHWSTWKRSMSIQATEDNIKTGHQNDFPFPPSVYFIALCQVINNRKLAEC